MDQYGKYTLWGIPKGEKDALYEQILSSRCNTREQIQKIIALARKDGFHSFRVTENDGEIPDFSKAINV